MWVVYVTFTDDCTYCFEGVYGFAKTEIGAIELEDQAKKEYPYKDIFIEKITFYEDK